MYEFGLLSFINVELDRRVNITIEDVNPNVTRSDKESNWTPNFDLTFNILAKNPSKKSQTKPNKTKAAKPSISPFSPKTTATHPKKRFKNVNVFGRNQKNFIF